MGNYCAIDTLLHSSQRSGIGDYFTGICLLITSQKVWDLSSFVFGGHQRREQGVVVEGTLAEMDDDIRGGTQDSATSRRLTSDCL